jgi:D-threo-aldose 1-dehydrogenase
VNPAEQVELGRTGLKVTRLGLGTAPLAGLYREVREADALATLEAGWDAGLRFFDTAPLYGYGNGEIRTGKVLRGKPRSEFTLATKVGRLLRADAPPDPHQDFHGTPPVNPVFDFSYDGVMRSVEESRERLGIERIDILHIHDPDHHYFDALHGAYRALDELRAKGVIGAVGAGMNQAEMLTRFAEEADFDCFLLAGRYTLLEQAALDSFLPLCVRRNIAVIIGGPFNTGILATGAIAGATYNYRPATEAVRERVRSIESVCREHGVALASAALQFPLHHPAVASVIPGARSAGEVAANVATLEAPIPPALWQALKHEGLLRSDAPTP